MGTSVHKSNLFLVLVILFSCSLSCNKINSNDSAENGTWYASHWAFPAMGGISSYEYHEMDELNHIIEITQNDITWYSYGKHFHNPFFDTTMDSNKVYLTQLTCTKNSHEMSLVYFSETYIFSFEEDIIVFKVGSQTDGFTKKLLFAKYNGNILPEAWPEKIEDTLTIK